MIAARQKDGLPSEVQSANVGMLLLAVSAACWVRADKLMAGTLFVGSGPCQFLQYPTDPGHSQNPQRNQAAN